MYVDAGASAFGAEGAFVLWVCDVFLSVLGWRWLREWDVLLSNKFNRFEGSCGPRGYHRERLSAPNPPKLRQSKEGVK